jgi:hypothetical protein
MKRKQMTVLALAAMLAAGMASAGLYDTWDYKAQIQFTGYSKSETLTNFPALVVLGTNITGFAYSQFKSGSNDLAFTADAAGLMNLNYEIDTWNTNGASYVWVQVPALVGNSTITVWWGASGQTTPAYTTNGATWDASYAVVWHLGQSGNGTTGEFTDSTGNTNNGTGGGGTAYMCPVQTNGVISNAQRFDGIDDYVVSAHTSANSTNFAMEGWLKLTSAASNQRPMSLGANGPVLWTSGVNNLGMVHSGTIDWNPAVPMPANQWCYIAVTRSGSTGTMYINGVQKAQGTWSTSYTFDRFCLGKDVLSIYSDPFGGGIDEARVSTIVRSSNWVWACYLNMASNGVFNTYGAAGQNNVNLPSISDVGSQNLSSTSADVVGTLITNGASGTATVYLYWSTTDGTTNASTWTTGSGSVSNLGSFADGTTFTNTLTNLTSDTTYYWNYSASNSAGTAWGATAGSPWFKTLGTPGVSNGTATSVAEFSATLNGNLTNGGSAHVYILLGLQDGIWSVTNDVGTRTEGAFSFPVSGLTLGTKYYYACYVTNAYGTAQAMPSTNFTTLPAVTYTFNSNNNNWTVAGNWTGGSYPPPRNGDIGIVSNITAYANGNLYTVGVETPPAQIWVRTNGSLQIANGVGLAEHNLILDGGTLSEQAYNGMATNNGSIRVNRNSTIGGNYNDTLMLNGSIRDNGANTGLLQIGPCGGYPSTIYLNGTNNTWTGGAMVGGGSGSAAPVVYAGAPGCLGTGSITVTNGMLVTATARPADMAHISAVAVTNVFGCSTVTVCGASATVQRDNISGELEVLGDSPNATYLLNSGGVFAMHTNLVGGTMILNGGRIGITDLSYGGYNNFYDYWNVNPTFYGPIRVRSNSYLGSGANEVLAFSGVIQDDGSNTGTLITLPPTGYQQTINLYNTVDLPRFSGRLEK